MSVPSVTRATIRHGRRVGHLRHRERVPREPNRRLTRIGPRLRSGQMLGRAARVEREHLRHVGRQLHRPIDHFWPADGWQTVLANEHHSDELVAPRIARQDVWRRKHVAGPADRASLLLVALRRGRLGRRGGNGRPCATIERHHTTNEQNGEQTGGRSNTWWCYCLLLRYVTYCLRPPVCSPFCSLVVWWRSIVAHGRRLPPRRLRRPRRKATSSRPARSAGPATRFRRPTSCRAMRGATSSSE